MATPTAERAATIRRLVSQLNECSSLQARIAADLFNTLFEDGGNQVRFGHGPGRGPNDHLWNGHELWRSADQARIQAGRALAPFGLQLLEIDSPSLREYPASEESTDGN